MLLPALGKARDKARTVSCVNNLKQHGLSWAMYVGYNDDFFVEDKTWGKLFYESKLLEAGTFSCPSQRRSPWTAGTYATPIANWGDNNFAYGGHYAFNRTFLCSTRCTSIRYPADTVLLVEARRGSTCTKEDTGYCLTTSYLVINPNAYSGQVYPAHNNGRALNTLWVDGHVTTINLTATGLAGVQAAMADVDGAPLRMKSATWLPVPCATKQGESKWDQH
jgi:prepilin-type processing-associated H-X9-DG protein